MANRPTSNNAKSKARYPEELRKVIAEDIEGFYRWNAKRADEGDVSAALEMLHGFCDAIEEGRPLPNVIRDYLLKAFSHYLSNSKPIDKALNLVPPANRPKGVRTIDPVRAVATLYLHVKRDGKNKDTAKDETCVALGVSKRNLERLDRDWKSIIRELNVAELEQLAQPVAPSPRGAKNSF